MRDTLLILLLTAAAQGTLAQGITFTKNEAITVNVTGGSVRGDRFKDGSIVFRGIPYAAPPVGELRWRPPQPVNPWTGIREATIAGRPCLQPAMGWNDRYPPRASEDCLYLDVRTRSVQPIIKKPVMIWIHGGANLGGYGSETIESNIVERNVVLVTLQYRLGVLGFLSHPALTAESSHDSSGNYGFLDQVAALKWVQENIAKFGGDPGNVTVFGHSAGGQGVGVMMLTPVSKGLFAKAIEQSGTAGFGLPPRSLRENEALGEQLAKQLKIPAGGDTLKALRARSGDALVAAGQQLTPHILDDDNYIWLQAVVDGWVLPRPPLEILTARQQHPVDLLIGSNTREFPLSGGSATVRATVEKAYGANAKQALTIYGLDRNEPVADDARLGDIGTQVVTDIHFRCPAVSVANLHAAGGYRVWQYELDRAEPGSQGVVRHSAELAYVLDNAPAGAAGGISQPRLQAYWTNFARTGDPNGMGMPEWPRFSGGDAGYLAFTEQGPEARQGLRASLCALLIRP